MFPCVQRGEGTCNASARPDGQKGERIYEWGKGQEAKHVHGKMWVACVHEAAGE